jgi:hypothetical protein
MAAALRQLRLETVSSDIATVRRKHKGKRFAEQVAPLRGEQSVSQSRERLPMSPGEARTQ